jgi:hypothetical protein
MTKVAKMTNMTAVGEPVTFTVIFGSAPTPPTGPARAEPPKMTPKMTKVSPSPKPVIFVIFVIFGAAPSNAPNRPTPSAATAPHVTSRPHRVGVSP